jgi:RNA polymerase sigma-70 factor (ECF subfamily)
MSGYALPAEVEEQQVLLSWQHDHNDGLELLYRRYAAPLTAFCERRLGSRGEAEDAAHETILKASRALPRFRSGARLWPWLATIAANVCTDLQRLQDRWEPEDESMEAVGVDEHMATRARTRIVDAAIEELPERFRTPLVLREFMGWSYEDIAAFSGKTIGSVRTTLMRARRALESRIEELARRQGHWPLPVAVAARWRRVRGALRSWRRAVNDRTHRICTAAWQAESLALVGGGVQALVVAVAAVAAFGPTPAGASVTHFALPPTVAAAAGAAGVETMSTAPATTPIRSSEQSPAPRPAGAAPRTTPTSVTVPVAADPGVRRWSDGTYQGVDTSPSVSAAGRTVDGTGVGAFWDGCGTTVRKALCDVRDTVAPKP